MERAKGIEPSYEAWEAAVLPLNYAREVADSIASPDGHPVMVFRLGTASVTTDGIDSVESDRAIREGPSVAKTPTFLLLYSHNKIQNAKQSITTIEEKPFLGA